MDRNALCEEIKRRVHTRSGSGVKVINIVGGAASGKTTLANFLANYLGNACTLSTDDYLVGDRTYRRENFEGKAPLLKYDPKKLIEDIIAIKELKAGEIHKVPTYNEETGVAIVAETYTKEITPVKYIIVEGDFPFLVEPFLEKLKEATPDLSDYFDAFLQILKGNLPDIVAYLDVADDNRKNNRKMRDVRNGREVDDGAVDKSFELRQRTQHYPYTAPVKGYADIVITADMKKGVAKDDDMYEYTMSFNHANDWRNRNYYKNNPFEHNI